MAIARTPLVRKITHELGLQFPIQWDFNITGAKIDEPGNREDSTRISSNLSIESVKRSWENNVSENDYQITLDSGLNLTIDSINYEQKQPRIY
jgi:hypothetical protein